MKKIAFFLVFLVHSFPQTLCASAIEVASDTIEVLPGNIEITGVKFGYEDTGSPYLGMYFCLPEYYEGDQLEIVSIVVTEGRGQRTAIEFLPVLLNSFHRVAITAVRYEGELTNIQLKAVYGDKLSIPHVLSLDLKNFKDEFDSRLNSREPRRDCQY